mgnify:CR=1 FL=1
MIVSKQKTDPEFGTPDWAMQIGKSNARLIRQIRTGGYRKARKFFSYYQRKRRGHGAAVRAVNVVSRIGNPKPYYVKDNVIYALNAIDTFKMNKPIYWPMSQRKESE